MWSSSLRAVPAQAGASGCSHAGGSAADLARKLVSSRITVAKVIQALREAGGWYNPLAWPTCIQCEEALATTPRQSMGPKKMHARCRSAYEAERGKRRWAAMSSDQREAELARLAAFKASK